MSSFDTVIRGGTVVTEKDSRIADVGIKDGLVAALGHDLTGTKIIDATGKLVLPGGIDSHCHIEQVSSFGIPCADDFYSGTVSAAFGGITLSHQAEVVLTDRKRFSIFLLFRKRKLNLVAFGDPQKRPDLTGHQCCPT